MTGTENQDDTLNFKNDEISVPLTSSFAIKNTLYASGFFLSASVLLFLAYEDGQWIGIVIMGLFSLLGFAGILFSLFSIWVTLRTSQIALFADRKSIQFPINYVADYNSPILWEDILTTVSIPGAASDAHWSMFIVLKYPEKYFSIEAISKKYRPKFDRLYNMDNSRNLDDSHTLKFILENSIHVNPNYLDMDSASLSSSIRQLSGNPDIVIMTHADCTHEYTNEMKEIAKQQVLSKVPLYGTLQVLYKWFSFVKSPNQK